MIKAIHGAHDALASGRTGVSCPLPVPEIDMGATWKFAYCNLRAEYETIGICTIIILAELSCIFV